MSTPRGSDSIRSNSHPELPDSDHNNRRAASLYHGPTSTAYDDTIRSNHGVGNVDLPNDPASEDWAKNLLFVQTARQRWYSQSLCERNFSKKILQDN